jgi:NADH:ubiquinone oxidoreductase subunit 2 (subunit N)
MFYVYILLLTALISLFCGGYYLERGFSLQDRTQFHLAGLVMLAGVFICVLLTANDFLGIWHGFLIMSVPTSVGYLFAR